MTPHVYVSSDFASPSETIAQYRQRTRPAKRTARVRRFLHELGRALHSQPHHYL